MKGFLQRLASRASGRGLGVRPRVPSLFEPPATQASTAPPDVASVVELVTAEPVSAASPAASTTVPQVEPVANPRPPAIELALEPAIDTRRPIEPVVGNRSPELSSPRLDRPDIPPDAPGRRPEGATVDGGSEMSGSEPSKPSEPPRTLPLIAEPSQIAPQIAPQIAIEDEDEDEDIDPFDARSAPLRAAVTRPFEPGDTGLAEREQDPLDPPPRPSLLVHAPVSVVSARRPPERGAAIDAAGTQRLVENVVRVSIGRLEVQAVDRGPSKQTGGRQSERGSSLADYARRRREASR